HWRWHSNRNNSKTPHSSHPRLRRLLPRLRQRLPAPRANPPATMKIPLLTKSLHSKLQLFTMTSSSKPAPCSPSLMRVARTAASSLVLHRSSNKLGGQAIVLQHQYGLRRDELLFPGAPPSIKFASGENPKRVYGQRQQLPSPRMGNCSVMRQAFLDARDYMRD